MWWCCDVQLSIHRALLNTKSSLNNTDRSKKTCTSTFCAHTHTQSIATVAAPAPLLHAHRLTSWPQDKVQSYAPSSSLCSSASSGQSSDGGRGKPPAGSREGKARPRGAVTPLLSSDRGTAAPPGPSEPVCLEHWLEGWKASGWSCSPAAGSISCCSCVWIKLRNGLYPRLEKMKTQIG